MPDSPSLRANRAWQCRSKSAMICSQVSGSQISKPKMYEHVMAAIASYSSIFYRVQIVPVSGEDNQYLSTTQFITFNLLGADPLAQQGDLIKN